jgi:uncharacterized FAD-dependent dehydrogenase
MIYDVIIIGAGAAGIFAAMELVNHSKLNILLLEKARRLNDTRNTGLGWFGGSARSNVHMFVEPDFGGNVAQQRTIDMFVRRLNKYGGSKVKLLQSKIPKKIIKTASDKGLIIEEPMVISYSEDKMIKLGNNLYSELKDKATVFHKADILSIRKEGAYFHIITSEQTFKSRACILSMGRAGAKWLINSPDFVKPTFTQSNFQFGVKLEFPTQSLKAYISRNPFFRFKFDDFKTSVPSFSGSIETEEVNNVKIANTRNLKAGRGNVASMSLLKTFNSANAINDVYRLCEITNILSDTQLLREPVSRWLTGSSVLSSLPEFQPLKDGLVKLLTLVPELKNRLVVYGPEARLNAAEFKLSKNMESDINRLFIIGDMSGKTHSFVQAACSGILAAQAIIK